MPKYFRELLTPPPLHITHSLTDYPRGLAYLFRVLLYGPVVSNALQSVVIADEHRQTTTLIFAHAACLCSRIARRDAMLDRRFTARQTDTFQCDI